MTEEPFSAPFHLTLSLTFWIGKYYGLGCQPSGWLDPDKPEETVRLRQQQLNNSNDNHCAALSAQMAIMKWLEPVRHDLGIPRLNSSYHQEGGRALGVPDKFEPRSHCHCDGPSPSHGLSCRQWSLPLTPSIIVSFTGRHWHQKPLGDGADQRSESSCKSE